MTSFMISKVINNPKIDIFENHSVIGILQENQECYGVRTWKLVTESEELFYADNTFLTLGGTSAIYKRTTNPHTTIGDGLASIEILNDERKVVADGKGESGTLHVEDPHLWQTRPGTPYLYTLHATCGADVYDQTFGVRSIEVRGTQVLLNGKPLYF